MFLDGFSLDVQDSEAEIAQRLRNAEELDSNVESACAQFQVILAKVLRRISKKHALGYWLVDDLYCYSFDRRDEVVTLRGSSYWLSGGKGCDRFRLDVSVDENPILYSFKFIHGENQTQSLYIGKTPEGWVVNGAPLRNCPND